MQPPHNIEAERAVLGAILLNPDVLSDVRFLDANHFFIVRHQLIYAALDDLYTQNVPIDLVTLGAYLEQRHTLERIGGVAYLMDIVRETPSSLAAEGYADIVVQLALRRDLIDTARRMVSMAHSSEMDIDDVLEQSIDAVQQINDQRAQRIGNPLAIDEVAADTLLDAVRRADSPCDIPGMKSGLDPLDSVLGGFERGQLYYIAGRPGMGKSALLSQIARGALDDGRRVLVFSLEMQASALVRRMICQRAHVGYTAVLRGRLTRGEMERFQHEARHLMNMSDRLLIECQSGLSIRAMMTIARRVERDGGLDMVIIDTINRVGDVIAARDQYHGMTTASHLMADWAHDSSLAIVAAAQLSRAGQHAADKRPTLSDLRDSGAQEEDADVILGLYRPYYYDQTDITLEHLAEILFLKNREGQSGARVILHFEATWPGFAKRQEERK